MKTKAKELDVDFIGGQGALTTEEEQKISEFLRNQKSLKLPKKTRAGKATKKKKVAA
jgi:hypothetical protein